MSQKRKQQRANHTEQEKKQAEKVIAYICGGLLALGIIYMAYTMFIM